MTEKTYTTDCGPVRYWVSEPVIKDRLTLVFLPGLTADHRLFDKQIGYFEKEFNLFVWDAPGHAASRPVELTFTLADKARWLKEILEKEGIESFVLVGQSMGAYVSQAFLQAYPDLPAGFVSIDSAPLARSYTTGWEIWLMKHIEPMYRMYPWKQLKKDGADGTAETEYGRNLMREMMQVYEEDPSYYAKLTGHGYRMLAGAYEADLPYRITCPAMLICGKQDKAGFTKKYNRVWSEKTGIPVQWIEGAGHNSNTDQPEKINPLIREFLRTLEKTIRPAEQY